MIAVHAVRELVIKKHEAWWDFLIENQESVAQLHFALLKIVESSLALLFRD